MFKIYETRNYQDWKVEKEKLIVIAGDIYAPLSNNWKND